MSFIDWINSSYPNPSVDGRWGWLHITVLVLAIASGPLEIRCLTTTIVHLHEA